ncbi:MAG: glycosyltransferase [Solirubrobacterales bacterium]|nr:glycosyltransferase [Solirubrobacterales bacterium]
MDNHAQPGDGSFPIPFSVVICAYTMDRLEEIGCAIQSVRAQTRQALETILVIDHSPDLLEQSRRRWPDVDVIPNSEARGLSGARNSGVAESRGEVVAFLDDDATAAPDWIEVLARAYADPRVLAAGGTVRPRWLAGRPSWFPPEFDWVVGCTHSGMPAERSAVRNLVGANMSLRRDALEEVGGFRKELGRIGTLPVGCEETDLCIRVSERWPDGVILYDPAATVDHLVPAERGTLRYFRERCGAEGRSKAVLTKMLGSESGLSEERSYVRRTLPLGFARGAGDALRGDPAGLARSAMLGVGLARTTAGYLGARGSAQGSVTGRRAATESVSGTLRVLMVTPRSPLAQGGVERHVMEVSRRMAAAGVDVQVLCTDPEVKGVEIENFDGVEIRTVRAHPRGRDYYLAPRLWGEMGAGEWDIVHVQSYHTLVAPLAMLRALTLGIPYVVTFHGGGHTSGLRNRMRRTQMRLLRPLLRRAARLVAVARFEVERYGRELRVPAERFELIPNGTDPSFSDAAGHGVGDPYTLATIGRLERYKGHHRVLAAFPLVLEREPQARLLIVGKGPYEAELRKQAAALEVEDRVEFTSVPPESPGGMADLLGRVALVVLLSDFETHPLVGIEAAAARRRLLVSDSSGLAELAEDGFARPISVEEPATVVAEAIVEELGRPAPQEAPNLTTWEECASALLDLYRRVA